MLPLHFNWFNNRRQEVYDKIPRQVFVNSSEGEIQTPQSRSAGRVTLIT